MGAKFMQSRKIWVSSIALFYASCKVLIILVVSGYLAKELLLNMINLIIWFENKELKLSMSYLNELDINAVSILLIIFFTLLIAYLLQRLIPDPFEKYLTQSLIKMYVK